MAGIQRERWQIHNWRSAQNKLVKGSVFIHFHRVSVHLRQITLRPCNLPSPATKQHEICLIKRPSANESVTRDGLSENLGRKISV